ncbi:DUF1990 family protein [Nocardioides sp. YIM 152315]|uniref:DUF1990 family protein n=1 Tax=Nocardioides sp. YIM 152315 TaxID=3031760 RepID=UPI0023DABF58|nr:DUF1990 family protein [Nocardioides sp. YIM 152315]MDF1606080.1 DUF1990 family protein [Nocardioides sp. YIM 152315]
MSGAFFDRIDPAVGLESIASSEVNYGGGEVDPGSWQHDVLRADLPSEGPGEPEPRGYWETACRLVEAYEFADPRLIRAVYREGSPLHGRDMLLEGRYAFQRFYFGVRVTDVIDEQRGDGLRVWGWAYETLRGHLERGRMSYEVVKHQDTGAVELVIRAVSQGAPTLGPLTRLGWATFGTHVQHRFYRACGERLRILTTERHGRPDPVGVRRTADGLVLAPSDAISRWWDRFAVRRHEPG